MKPSHLERYRDIARLLFKYGRRDLLHEAGLDGELADVDGSVATDAARADLVPRVHERPGEILERARAERANQATKTVEPSPPAHERTAEEIAAGLATDLEKMGPTFIKVGQFLSTRADLLPAPYLEALARLQDQIEPFSFEDVERIVSEDLGIRLSKAFNVFEDIPVAAASLGQVHRAELRSGHVVAVKVQRPGVRERILEDLEVLAEVASMMDRHTEVGKRYGFTAMLEEFRKSLLRELDYAQEARNLATLGRNLARHPLIVVPQPVEDYVTARVLTMEFVTGRKVTSLGPLAKLELDGHALAEELCKAYLQQFLIDGFFHADPHPGNVLLTDDGRVALIDLGMTGRISPGMQEQLLKLVMAISEGHGDEAGDLVVRLGRPRVEARADETRGRIAEMVMNFQGMRIRDIALGRLLFEAANVASAGGYRMPTELTMLSKALLNVDEVARTLDPEFDPNASIRRNVARILRRRMLKSVSPGRLFSSALEMKEFAEKLPRRLNRLVDAIAENRVRIQVDALNEVLLMEGLQKIANRITLGLVISALVVGAALLMRVETTFRILGYPGLAIIMFLGAALCAGILIVNILTHDLRAEKDRLRQHEPPSAGRG